MLSGQSRMSSAKYVLRSCPLAFRNSLWWQPSAADAASRPELVIADEPTGNLDPELSLDIMRLFERFNEVGVTLLIATHDLELIDKLQHRRLRLDQGKVVEETLWDTD